MDPLESNPGTLQSYGFDPDAVESFQSRVDQWLQDGSFTPGLSLLSWKFFSDARSM